MPMQVIASVFTIFEAGTTCVLGRAVLRGQRRVDLSRRHRSVDREETASIRYNSFAVLCSKVQ